jgi:predicted dehydrogenase
VGKVVRFRSEMFSQTVIREDEGAGWRASRASGGGVTYEMAAHAIDLISFLFGKPHRVGGTSMSRVFSRAVEDVVSSTFFYDNGMTGTIYVNWSDPSYRKPTNKLEVFGDRGRIVADQHGMKVYVTAPDERFNLQSGWNSIYITDVFSNVPFFVRGIEFTAQLHHFVDCVRAGGGAITRCTFADASATLAIIDDMFEDAT